MSKEYIKMIEERLLEMRKKASLDPVGKADADIDNDGDVDASDEYLKKRRAAIKKSMKKEDDDKTTPCPKCDGSMENHDPECPNNPDNKGKSDAEEGCGNYDKKMKKEEVEMNEQFVVKYAKNKRGPIYQTKFKTQPEAEKFLVQKRKEGMNGIVSKAGKPVSMQKMADLQKEEVEMNEAIDYMKVSKELDTYAKKHGGIDKGDFEKTAMLVRKIGGNSNVNVQDKANKELMNHIRTMDTDPRDRVALILKKGGFKFTRGRIMREEVEHDLDENFRTLATKGMGAETKKTINVGRDVDYYEPKNGDKRQGRITKVHATGYHVKDEKDGKTHSFTFHDRAKAKKMLESNQPVVSEQWGFGEVIETTEEGLNVYFEHGVEFNVPAEDLTFVGEAADRAKHYKGAAKPETMLDKFKGAGAKKMATDNNVESPKEADITPEERGHEDATKAGRAVSKQSPTRRGEPRKGDISIVNPVKGAVTKTTGKE